MPRVKRFSFLLAFSLFASLAAAVAQTPSVSTVNVTPDEQKVRISTVGDVLDMSLAVSDESGDVVFESGAVTGDHLDWAMKDTQGRRVPPGSYTLMVTYRTPAGKLKRRVEQVLVTEEATGESRQESAAPTPAAPIEGSGATGKIAKFTSANTLGNSVMMESAGRIGINTVVPSHALTVFGGPSWTTSGWTGSITLPNAGAIGWVANGAGQRRGIGHGANGLYFFRTTSNPGSAISVAVPDLVINNIGNVGVGTTTASSKLTVNGGVQILGSGNGIKFPDGSIQTKAIAGTITGTGTTNRLAKFTGPSSFGNSSITESAGKVGIGTSTPQQPLEIATGRMRFSSNLGDIEFTETADMIGYATTASPNGALPAFRVGVGTGSTEVFTVLNNGKVGIRAPATGSMLEVRGDGSTFLLRVIDSGGNDALKVVNNGVVSFGALYSLSSTNHLCYHAPSNLVFTSCSSAAEYVPTVDNGSGFPETADLVSIAPARVNPYGDNHAPFVVQKSATPCDDQLLGYIINPESGADGKKKNEHYLPLAIYGYFPAKVTTENGAIKRGDPITSSSRPGYGMKATGACKIIGYALEDADREGKIQVFANSREYAAPQVKALQAQVEELRRGRETEVETLRRENAAIKARLETLERAVTVSAANR